MKPRCIIVTIFTVILVIATLCHAGSTVQLSPHVTVCQDSINGVFVNKDGKTLVFYGDPCGNLKKADKVLFTHNRRDVVWAGRELVENGAQSFVPAQEADSFSKAEDFWTSFAKV